MIDKFFATVFDLGDLVWAASKDLSMRKCFAAEQSVARGVYVGNDFSGGAYLAVNAGKERRCMENTLKFRTFLLEFDDGPLAEQAKFWKSKGLPFSALVNSAGKSLHFWLSLVTPLSSIGEYKEYFARLSILLEGKNDKQCADPCRYARFPGALRDGRRQEILRVYGRVPNEVLKARLFTPEITAEYEKLYTQSTVGGVYEVANKVPIEKAVEFLTGKYPLLSGEKQPRLAVWARYLAGSCGCTPEQIVEILEENDQGKNKIHSEYERVAGRFAVEVVTTISEETWRGV